MDLNGLNWRKSSYSSSNGACVEVGVAWRKSSYSTSNSNCVEVAVTWRTSSYSTSNGNCVEVGMTPQTSSDSTSNGGGCAEAARPSLATVAVRDSKDPEGPVLTFSPAAWQAFTSRLKAGEPGLG